MRHVTRLAAVLLALALAACGDDDEQQLAQLHQGAPGRSR